MVKKPLNSAPWVSRYRGIKARCANKKNARYGGRGITNFLTPAKIRYLWFRDKAYEMAMPSLDRIDNDGPYHVTNCRFIERSANSARCRLKWTLETKICPSCKSAYWNTKKKGS